MEIAIGLFLFAIVIGLISISRNLSEIHNDIESLAHYHTSFYKNIESKYEKGDEG